VNEINEEFALYVTVASVLALWKIVEVVVWIFENVSLSIAVR
jgi:hypothetical protein